MNNSVQDLKPRGKKVPMYLLPYRPLRAIVSAFHDGATKYEPNNWRRQDGSGDWKETYVSALLRHVCAYNDPDESDWAQDSQVHHLSHAAACIIILLYLEGIDYEVPQSVQNENEFKKFKSEWVTLCTPVEATLWGDYTVKQGDIPLFVEVQFEIRDEDHSDWDSDLYVYLSKHDPGLCMKSFPEMFEEAATDVKDVLQRSELVPAGDRLPNSHLWVRGTHQDFKSGDVIRPVVDCHEEMTVGDPYEVVSYDRNTQWITVIDDNGEFALVDPADVEKRA